MFRSNWRRGFFWAGLTLVGIIAVAIIRDARITWPLVIVVVVAMSQPLLRHVIMPKVRGAGRRARSGES